MPIHRPLNIATNLICELPGFDEYVDINQQVQHIAKLFSSNPKLPGIIVTDHYQFVGMISRDRCFEALGRPFGIELFNKLSVKQFFFRLGINTLVLPADTTIDMAVRSALMRNHDELYDPIIVRETDHFYLVDMHTLLIRQSELLSQLNDDFHQLSICDPLTNINNRRGLFEVAQLLINESWIKKGSLSLMMIDIDHFKKVNDQYGHSTGDRVIVSECKKLIRQTDVIGRFGGEEFVVVLPDTETETAILIAERIRSRIENLLFLANGESINFTVSIGISQITNTDGSLDTLIIQADQALYYAKRSGRNRVAMWDQKSIEASRSIDSGIENKSIKVRRVNNRISAGKIFDETINGWVHAIELRDKEAVGHAHRVANLTMDLAQRIGIRDQKLDDLRRGALLHDIGKIAIPDEILFKPGKLTDDEWEIMKKHPDYAYEMLTPISFLQNSLDIPYCHYEHWDGTGYPRDLREFENPIAARIFTVIDVWDALSSDRCYRKAWNQADVQDYIIQNKGLLFDPEIVDIFLSLLRSQYETDDISLVTPFTQREFHFNETQMERS